MIMPFASAFTVNNLGIGMEKLPMIYMITGLASILIGPLIGKVSDTYGGMKVFFFGTIVSSVMVMIYTHLGATPLWLVIAVNVAMFVGIFSRMIPSQTLMSAIPSPANRGSFMSVSSSLQQLAGGLGAIIAGAIVVQESSGMIRHFEVIGYIMVTLGLLILGMMFFINRAVENLKSARKESV